VRHRSEFSARIASGDGGEDYRNRGDADMKHMAPGAIPCIHYCRVSLHSSRRRRQAHA
jgi:hypothetical protein